MVDVNLLPEELRGREAAERRRLGKTPKVVEFTLTNPPRSKSGALKPGGFGVGRPLPPPPPAAPPPREAVLPTPVASLPKRLERVAFTRGQPAAAPAAVPSAALPAATLDAAEVAALATVVKQAVYGQPPMQPGPPTAGGVRTVAGHARWPRFGWFFRLLSRPPRVPRQVAAVRRRVPPPVVPPPRPLPPVPPPLPSLSRISRPRVWGPGVGWWQRLRVWFSRLRGAAQPMPKTTPPIRQPVVPTPPRRPSPRPSVRPKVQARPVLPAAIAPAVSHPIQPPAPPRVRPKPTAVGHPPKTLAVNLIPDEFTRHPELNLSRKFFIYLAALGLSVFAVVTVSQFIGWYLYRNGNEIRDLEQRNTLVAAQIETYQTTLQAAIQLERDLQAVEHLLTRQRYWTQVFFALERLTVDEVWYGSLTAAADGAIELTASGKDYSSVARQLAAFQQARDVVEQVSIVGASAVGVDAAGHIQGVSFAVTLKLKPTVFGPAVTGPPL